MDKDIIKTIVENIINKSLGRAIVSCGDMDEGVKSTLFEVYGISIVLKITTDNKKNDSVKVKHIKEIAGQSDRFFIIMTELKFNEAAQKLLNEYGFDPALDCAFFEHSPIILSGPFEKYEDEYGNRIINCPLNCRMTILGFCNDVVFDRVICPSPTNIKLRNKAKILIGNNTRLSGLITCFSDNWELTTGSNCKLTGVVVDFHKNAKMNIGNDTTIYGDTQISIGYQELIKIGEDCMFAESVMLLCGDCHAIFDIPTQQRINGPYANKPKKNIIIGNHVWLGKRSCLLAGSTVGDGCVIGACACFKGHCPNNVVVVGNPGKIIRKNISWARDYLEQNICKSGYYLETEEHDEEL